MKTILISLLIVMFLATSSVAIDLTADDKIGHMFTSGVYGFAMGELAKDNEINYLQAFLIANTPGLLKEAIDKEPDPEDLLANVIGVVVGLVGSRYSKHLHVEDGAIVFKIFF